MKRNVIMQISGLLAAIALSSCSGSAVVPETVNTPLDTTIFNKLKGGPTLDLVEDGLESKGYQPNGYPVLPLPAPLKAAILTHEQGSPTPYTPSASALASCQFSGMRIELDDKADTAEWLFTPDNRCGKQSPHQVKTFWILQQVSNEQPKVLLADRTFRVRIAPKEAAQPMRRVALMLKSKAPSSYTGKLMDVQCHLSWKYANGTYQKFREFVEVYRQDPMLSGTNWMQVYGSDPYANVDSRYQCPLD